MHCWINATAGRYVQDGMNDEEAQALRAEGLDPDDPPCVLRSTLSGGSCQCSMSWPTDLVANRTRPLIRLGGGPTAHVWGLPPGTTRRCRGESSSSLLYSRCPAGAYIQRGGERYD